MKDDCKVFGLNDQKNGVEEEGCLPFGKENQEFHFGHAKSYMTIRHSNRYASLVPQWKTLEF